MNLNVWISMQYCVICYEIYFNSLDQIDVACRKGFLLYIYL